MPGLDPATATRLAKICGLLASDQDGERSAAAYQATKILKAHGLGWDDVFRPALPAPPQRHQPRQAYAGEPSHITQARWALAFPERLSTWENGFLSDLKQRRSLSPKQASVLNDILVKLRRGGAA